MCLFYMVFVAVMYILCGDDEWRGGDDGDVASSSMMCRDNDRV